MIPPTLSANGIKPISYGTQKRRVKWSYSIYNYLSKLVGEYVYIKKISTLFFFLKAYF